MSQLTVGELKAAVARACLDWYNYGYSSTQESNRRIYERRLADFLERNYPDIYEEFSISTYHGLGYYSCYSDFAVDYKGTTLIGVGTHTSTVERKRYKAEVDVSNLGDICELFKIEDFEKLTLDKAVDCIGAFWGMQRVKQLQNQIAKKELEIKSLKEEVQGIQENIKGLQGVVDSLQEELNELNEHNL